MPVDTDTTTVGLDQVVVTGTPEAIRQFDAAFAVSTSSQQQIELYAPLSSVDLFGKLPGFGERNPPAGRWATTSMSGGCRARISGSSPLWRMDCRSFRNRRNRF